LDNVKASHYRATWLNFSRDSNRLPGGGLPIADGELQRVIVIPLFSLHHYVISTLPDQAKQQGHHQYGVAI
jgi:hypothetical protein